MNRTKIITAVVLLTTFEVLFFVTIGKADGQVLTLTEAVNLALAKNPTLKAAGYFVDASQAKVGQARSGLLPSIDFYEGYSRTNNPMLAVGSKLNQEVFSESDYQLSRLNDPSPVSNFNTQVVLTQPIFDQGKTFVGIKQAKLGKEMAETVRERIKQEVVYNVIATYSQVILAKEDLKLAEETEKVAEAHVILAEDLYQTGQAVKSDYLSAKVRLSEVKEMVVQAQSGLEIARAALIKAIGLEHAEAIEVEGELNYKEAGLDLDTIIAEALDKRPDLVGMEKKVKNGQAGIKMAKTDYLPGFNFIAQYDLNDEKDIWNGSGESWTIGGMFHFNLFKGLNTTYKVREAKEVLKQLSSEKEALRSGIEFEVREAFHQLKEAEGRIAVAGEAISHAEESLRIVEDRYGVGLSTMVAVLDNEVALTKARRNLLRAFYDCRVAQARVDLARGVYPLFNE